MFACGMTLHEYSRIHVYVYAYIYVRVHTMHFILVHKAYEWYEMLVCMY